MYVPRTLSFTCVKFFPTPFFHWRCHRNIQLSSWFTWERNAHLKPKTFSCIIQCKKEVLLSAQPTHNTLELLRAPLREAQGLAVLGQQVPDVPKWWPQCKRRVTASETWPASNNGDNVFCAEEVHLPEGNMYCVSRHRRWKLLQSFDCWAACACSPARPPFPCSPAVGQGRFANKQLNNIVGGNFPGVL